MADNVNNSAEGPPGGDRDFASPQPGRSSNFGGKGGPLANSSGANDM